MNANGESLKHSCFDRIHREHLSFAEGTSLIGLYGPFLAVIRVRNEWFLDRLDSEITTENTSHNSVSEEAYSQITETYH